MPDPWEVIREAFEEVRFNNSPGRGAEFYGAMYTLREEAEQLRDWLRGHEEYEAGLRSQVERQAAALRVVLPVLESFHGEVPGPDTADALLAVRAALSTEEPSEYRAPEWNKALLEDSRERAGEPSEEPSHGYHEAGDYP